MIYFAQAKYLYLLLLIPLLFLFYWLYLRVRSRRIGKFGDKSLVVQLMPAASVAKGWLKLSFFSLAMLCFFIGMARPQMGARLKKKDTEGVEVMICLDVSNSMLAQDYTPDRLDRAKFAISNLVDRLNGDRIGLVVFAGEAFVQLPITTDYVSAKSFLGSVNTESIPIQGTALADAINTASRSFSTGSAKSRAIILITDGENHEGDPVSAAKDAAGNGVRVYTIGVGTPEGKPIPMSDGSLLKDKDGNIVVTKLDEQTLKEIASAGNGIYVRAGNAEFGLNTVIDNIKEINKKKFESVVFEEYDEKYMYLFAAALLFFIIEMLIPDCKLGRKSEI
ncbi:MAG: VWA domain-containing protein [Bacteroidales bacterium]|jgi:Ca-activated chloride channel family protein|nr:VWA domain-containing protein [Bacteroidales bacterium]MCI2121583.1 VWA domain-containing protein [Bacteroidales bacterium]MCI2145699.1 VWA domain-containing protein [Bacteroidales bacterium]